MKKVLTGLCDWLRDEGWAVLFVVCLISVLHGFHWLGPVGSLSALSAGRWSVPGNVEPPSALAAEALVVEINQHRFLGYYGERAPLDRCKLRSDIASIRKPRVLAIDFDLSPLPAPTAEEAKCQKSLEDLIDSKGNGASDAPTVVLAVPESISIENGKPVENTTSSRSVDPATVQWFEKRRNAGAKLADSTVQSEINHVVMSTCSDRYLAEAVWTAARRSGPDCGSSSEPRPLNYHRFLQKVRVVPVEEAAKLPTGKVVFFGGIYGTDDRHATPVGELAGVQIHAARFVNIELRKDWSAVIAFVVDLSTAAVFSWLGVLAMGRYTHYAKLPSYWTAQRRVGVMVAFLFFFALLQRVALCLCLWLLVNGIWIEPLLISIGVTLDAFVIAPWRRLSHRHEAGYHRFELLRFGEGFRNDALGASYRGCVIAVFWGVIGTAFVLLGMKVPWPL